MLKQQAKIFNRISIIIDAIVIIASFVAAYCCDSFLVIMERSGLPNLTQLFDLEGLGDHAWLLAIILPSWYLLLRYFGFYSSLRTHQISELFVNLLKITTLGGLITSSIVYFINTQDYHRKLLIFFLLFSFVALIAEKSFLRVALGMIRRQGYNYRNLLIVGIPSNARRFIRLIEHHMDWGLRIVGILKVPNGGGSFQNNYPVLGEMDDLVTVCKKHTIDEVIFCVSRDLQGQIKGCLRDMQEMGITVRLVLDFYETSKTKMDLYLFHGEVPMVTFYSKPFVIELLFLKRILDFVGATFGLAMTTILTPFIALAIKFDSPGPIFFGQERIGEGGRQFTFWKFRSMQMDAEYKKKELLNQNEMSGAIFKIKDDPRVTRVGKFLRKTSLDELPQFWNVIRGDMSLVGTRPPTPEEVINYENWHRKRISIKPGITGLWQVSGRNQITDFDEIAKLDIEYIEKWSLWLDIKILFRTFFVVFTRRGSF
jgi:exopolysaccharide biosynthesis polyprenyl glycosylphosphotransferase